MARLPEVVADASTVCKWFVAEGGSESAVRLRNAHTDGHVRIIAPDLVVYEVANALRHHPSVSPSQLRSAMRFLFDLQIGLVQPSSASMGLAAAFAYRERLTVYDAVYAVLAETHDCRLVTDDAGLLRASNRAVPVSKWTLAQEPGESG